VVGIRRRGGVRVNDELFEFVRVPASGVSGRLRVK
jgi:hypothetical protein